MRIDTPGGRPGPAGGHWAMDRRVRHRGINPTAIRRKPVQTGSCYVGDPAGIPLMGFLPSSLTIDRQVGAGARDGDRELRGESAARAGLGAGQCSWGGTARSLCRIAGETTGSDAYMEGILMLSRSAWIVAALVGLVLGAAPLRADDPKIEGDLKKVQGEWSGRIMQSEALYTFKGRKLTLKGTSRSYEMTVTMNSEAKPERSIDLKIDEGPADAKGQTSLGIYKFDGDD